MKNVRLYETESAFAADATSRAAQAGSVISHVTESKRNMTEGKVRLIPLSAAQDNMIMVYSKSRQKRFVIDPADLASTLNDPDLVPGGVTFDCTATDGKITSLVNTVGKRWGQGLKIKLSEITGNFSIRLKCVLDTTVDVTLGTIAEMAAQLRVAGETSLTVTAGADYIALEMNDYREKIMQVTSGSENVTLTTIALDTQRCDMDAFFEAIGKPERKGICKMLNVLRYKGLSTSYGGCNFERFKAYYSVSGSQTANLSENSEDILRQSAFNATDNATLYNKFGGDYDAYLMSEMIVSETGRLTIGYRNCKAQNDALKDLFFTDIDGSQKPYFPSVYDQCQYGIATEGHTTGFEVGNWMAMDSDLTNKLMKGVKTNQSDPINVALGKVLGATKLSVTQYIWAVSLFSITNAYFYSGGSGALYGSSRYVTFGGRPFSAFSKTED